MLTFSNFFQLLILGYVSSQIVFPPTTTQTNFTTAATSVYPIGPSQQPGCILGTEPVCSMDNETFPTICILLLLGKQKQHDGWCQEKQQIKFEVSQKTANNGYLSSQQAADPHSVCPCNSVYNPVCGNNGVTYGSRCRMECAQVAFSHEGPCNYFNWRESPHYNCPCPYEFNPICGFDGSTYENKCVIQCGQQAVRYENACISPCNCTKVYKPVCSRTLKTYNNECLLRCADEELLQNGKCPSRTPSNCSQCKGLVSPVCSSIGLTYENRCYLDCAGQQFYSNGICTNDQEYLQSNNIQIVPCSSCENVQLPVCGNDGITYLNACRARCKGVAINYRGRCLNQSTNISSNGSSNFNVSISSQIRCNCSTELRPVCGSDNKTYLNQCEAKCAKIEVRYNNACQPINPSYCRFLCNNVPTQTVCGKDWRTYANECIASRCVRTPLQSQGACPPISQASPALNLEFNAVQMNATAPQNISTSNMNSQTVRTSSINNNTNLQTQPIIPPSNDALRRSTDISVSVTSSQSSQNSANVVFPSTVDLNSLESTLKVYWMLFPNNKPVSEKVLRFQEPLRKVLWERFKYDVTKY